jgi:hypothetical protein
MPNAKYKYKKNLVDRANEYLYCLYFQESVNVICFQFEIIYIRANRQLDH